MSIRLAVDRRKFLKGAAGSVAGLFASNVTLPVKQAAPTQSASAPMMPKEMDPSDVDVLTMERSGSDFMVDVLKSLGFEYVASNPGSSFRGLHESVINYGGNQAPEFITCCHEESAIGMAHGYVKIEGKPM
jgi:acetolactate synthase-1/2/3 large subunit